MAEVLDLCQSSAEDEAAPVRNAEVVSLISSDEEGAEVVDRPGGAAAGSSADHMRQPKVRKVTATPGQKGEAQTWRNLGMDKPIYRKCLEWLDEHQVNQAAK